MDLTIALTLVKNRLNRLPTDTTLDSYLSERLNGAVQELAGIGIALDDADAGDLMFLVDYAVWQYQSRDDSGAMPEWLRLRRRELWLKKTKGGGSA